MSATFVSFSASSAFLWATASGAASRRNACNGWSCYDPKKQTQIGAGTRAAKAGSGTKKARMETDFCDLPVLEADEVSHDLLRDWAWRGKPFVLRNSVAMRQEGFGKEKLAKDAEKLELQARIGYSWNIVQNRGEGPETLQLHEFLRTAMHRDLYDGETRLERPYLFHRFGDLLSLPSARLKIHSVFTAWNNTAFQQETSTPIVLVGAADSGVGFHMHQASVQMTIHGWKRWFLYPPTANPPGGVYGAWSILEWFKIIYPTLQGESKPLECIQKPGDSFWVPEFWYHATINLADTVAISIQRADGETEVSELHKLYESVSEKRTGIDYVRRILELQPDHIASQFTLSKLYVENEPDEALRILREIVRNDRYHVDAQQFLVDFLQDRIYRRIDGASQELQSLLSEWRPYLENNTRSIAANRMLALYHQLMGNRDMSLHYNRRNAQLRKLGIKDGREREDEFVSSYLMYVVAILPLLVLIVAWLWRAARRTNKFCKRTADDGETSNTPKKPKGKNA